MNPPVDPKLLAQRELAVPGRYQLHVSVTTEKPSLWEQVLQWVYDRVEELWRALFGHVRISGKTSVAIADIVVALIAALVIFVAFRVLVQLQIERNARQATENIGLAPRGDAHALYLRAIELARNHEFAAAVRLLFIASIAALDLRGVVRDDPSSTVGDVRRYLRRTSAPLVAPFDEIAAPFMRVVYAQAPVDAEAWERAVAGYQALTREASA